MCIRDSLCRVPRDPFCVGGGPGGGELQCADWLDDQEGQHVGERHFAHAPRGAGRGEGRDSERDSFGVEGGLGRSEG
eukprot:6184618-Pyramimonas_sp.AAC.1